MSIEKSGPTGTTAPATHIDNASGAVTAPSKAANTAPKKETNTDRLATSADPLSAAAAHTSETDAVSPASIVLADEPTHAIDLFDLMPHAHGNFVSLRTTIDRILADDASKRQLLALVTQITDQLGVPHLTRQQQAVILADPYRIAELLVVTPQQLGRTALAMHKAHTTGQVSLEAQRKFDLGPVAVVDDLDALTTTPAKSSVKALLPTLYKGSELSGLPKDEANRNTALAEIFTRLAMNEINDSDAMPAEPFTAVYDGERYSSVMGLVEALRGSGHEVTLDHEIRATNFLDLKTPGSDGKLQDVAATLMIKGVDGIIQPAPHAEFAISVRPGPNITGPAISANVLWYHGTGGVGFFPANILSTPEWVRPRTLSKHSGDDAAYKLSLCATATAKIKQAAADQGLARDGYAYLGDCMDSTATISRASDPDWKATGFPFVMVDSPVRKVLQADIANDPGPATANQRELQRAIDELPSDAAPNAAPASPERRLSGLPENRADRVLVAQERAYAGILPQIY